MVRCPSAAIALLAFGSACTDPIVSTQGDAGETSRGETSIAGDPTPSTTVASSTTNGDSGVSTDTGSVDPQPADLCPSPSAEGVGIDTRMRIAFASEATPVSIVAEPMHLTCNGLLVAGSTITGVGQLVFVPDEVLPAQSGCEIVLEADAVTLDDAPVAERSWMFYTGELLGVEFVFAPPVALAELTGYTFGTIDADGDDVIVSWVGEFPMLARSTDRGDHFELSSVQPDVYGAGLISTHLQNGIVHATWLVNTLEGGPDCYYSRSEPGLGPMSAAMLVDDYGYTTFSYSPTVSSDGGDAVVLTWFETCNIDPPCNLPGPGVYMRRSDDGGVTFDEAVRVSGDWRTSPSAGPLLAWVDGGIAAAWNPEPFAYEGITILDGEADFADVVQFEKAMWPTLERAADGEAVMYWHERDNVDADIDVAKFARLRLRTADGIDPPRVVAERQGDGDFAVAMDVHGDVVTAVVAEGDAFRGPANRRLVLSLDGGETYLAPQVLDLLLDARPDTFPSDAFNAIVAVADAERIHLAWVRETEALSSELLYTHGDRIEPCGLRQRE